MDLRVLEYFLVVAREQNITKAAALLHITQPTLSRQLKQLEEELEINLFTRSNHHIVLTDEGRLFMRRATEMNQLLAQSKAELKQTPELVGEIQVGAVELQSMSELAEWLQAFQRIHPKVTFNIRTGNNQDVDCWLSQGLVDFGLFIEPANISQYNSLRMKTKEEWGVLVPQNSKFAEVSAIKPGDLVGTRVITISDRVVQHELVLWSGKHAKNMSFKAKYSSLYNAAIMAKVGQDVVICLKMEQTFEKLIFKPLEPSLVLPSSLAWHENKPNSKVSQAFIDFLTVRNE
jgi:DNA-binding transcriptional LysR family regulator